MVEQPVVNVVQHYLQSLQEAGLTVRFGVIFGSRGPERLGRGATLTCWWCRRGSTTRGTGKT